MKLKTLEDAKAAELRTAFIRECLKDAEFCAELRACNDPAVFCKKWGLTFGDGLGERAVENFHTTRQKAGRSREEWPVEYLISDVSEFGGMIPHSDINIRGRHCWDVLNENRADARKRLLVELTAELDAELNRIETEAVEMPNASQARWAQESHIRWLFLYQAKRQSTATIVKNEPMIESSKAVENAVKKLASKIGLIRRPQLAKGPKR